MLTFIRQLTHEAWRNLNHPPAYFDAMTEGAEASFLDAIAHHPKNFMLVAWQDGSPIGNFGITASPATFNAHSAELGLGVLRAFHGLHVGETLLRRGIAEASRVGTWNLILRVRTFNTAAIALYEKVGFERVGTLRAAAVLPEGIIDEYIYQRVGQPTG